jgi:hypothetical protein
MAPFGASLDHGDCGADSSQANSQTTSTGALTGAALDPWGAVVSGVSVSLGNQDSGATKSANSDEEQDSLFYCCRPADMR